MSTHVDETPGEVKIRYRSTRNVTDDRLHRRLAWLEYTFTNLRDYYTFKSDLWPRVGEAATLHREALRRGLDVTPYPICARYTVHPERKLTGAGSP